MEQDEDDWLEQSPGAHQGSSADPIVEQEYQRLAARYSDAGYREGITDGKLSALQQGFDESFATSVPLSRRLGQLRGQANALLAYLNRPASASTASAELVDAARTLVQDLSRVKRAEVLPRDVEREKHEQEEHEGHAFELDRTDQREMDGLEDALGALGSNGIRALETAALQEEALLSHFEARLKELLSTLNA